jgi:hypothetical protein
MGKQFKLEITFDADTKACQVTGPIDEPELCYLGLEMARRVIQESARKRIVIAPTTGPIASTPPKPLIPGQRGPLSLRQMLNIFKPER